MCMKECHPLLLYCIQISIIPVLPQTEQSFFKCRTIIRPVLPTVTYYLISTVEYEEHSDSLCMYLCRIEICMEDMHLLHHTF